MTKLQEFRDIYKDSPFDQFYATMDGIDQSEATRFREAVGEQGEGTCDTDDELEKMAEDMIGIFDQLIGLHNGDIEPEMSL